MRARISMLVAAAATLLATQPARAWDELGHRVIARIAWDHMTPLARERAVALLMAAPADAGLVSLLPRDGRPLADAQRELFVSAAYWPDQIRSRNHPGFRFAHSEWHYVNHFWEQMTPGGPIRDRPDLGTAGELVTQGQRMAIALGDATRPAADRAVDLAWVLHLVGDAHQPLHNSARITAQDTAGDRGGNLFLLAGLYPYNQLHGYWDALVGMNVPWQPTDRSEYDYVGSVARIIAERHPLPGMRGELGTGEFAGWSLEGKRVAQRVAFPAWLVRGQRAPWEYRGHAWRAGEARVAIAGYRLADLLNRALGS